MKQEMITRNIMNTKLITIEARETLAKAAGLLRQYQIHHLPVVYKLASEEKRKTGTLKAPPLMVLEGLVTSNDLHLTVRLAQEQGDNDSMWQARPVREVMHPARFRVSPTVPISTVAQIMTERDLTALPVVEYQHIKGEERAILLGLVTRNDLLQAMARALGAYEPGTQLDLTLPWGDLQPLTRTLQLISELQIPVRSIIAAPMAGSIPRMASIRLGTIAPTPLLVRLRQEGIIYSFGDLIKED